MKIPETIRPQVGELPPSGLGPDGKIIPMTDEERRARCQEARQRLREIAQMTDEDLPGSYEQFMRNLDEGRPHRPLFKGMY